MHIVHVTLQHLDSFKRPNLCKAFLHLAIFWGPPQEGGVQWDVFCLGGRFTPCVHTCPGVGLVCQWVPFTPGLHTCRPMERGDTSPPGRATFPANSGLSHLANALSAHLRALRIALRIISLAQKTPRLILRSLYLWLFYRHPCHGVTVT